MDILKKMQRLLVDFANKEGINLQDEFGTVEAFKKFVIALTFKALTDSGIETGEAYDMIFGNGQYEELAEKTWNLARQSVQS